MSEHTPGPWIVGHNGRSNTTIWVRQSDDYRMIAETHRSDDDDVVANAHLIAASPKLLKRLESLTRKVELEISNVSPEMGPAFAHELSEARAAIAEARGQQQ